ncbi:MAG: OsmC family protein [Alphaproteobacteria bacterium]|nr:OsmC family protein [Alphaproteobacteria bacterium]MBV9063801.1 OsmC family protein [Alphaproteobacteria bacterium]
MSEHHAGVRWNRVSADFTYQSYNRAHEMTFKNGAIRLAASSAPAFRGEADRVDPEEAYVASLASCHMLTLLAICARKRLTVESYEDDAVGFLEKGSGGKLWVTRVELHPRIRFAEGAEVDGEALKALHRQAHAECFIANSVKTEVVVEPPL